MLIMYAEQLANNTAKIIIIKILRVVVVVKQIQVFQLFVLIVNDAPD